MGYSSDSSSWSRPKSMWTAIAGSVQGSMSTRSSLGIAGKGSIVSSFISGISFGCSILMSFSMFLAISVSSPGLYAEEVSNRCADCLSSVWVIFFVN
jgi:hypothetical protein